MAYLEGFPVYVEVDMIGRVLFCDWAEDFISSFLITFLHLTFFWNLFDNRSGNFNFVGYSFAAFELDFLGFKILRLLSSFLKDALNLLID